jgi:hypothetical protein
MAGTDPSPRAEFYKALTTEDDLGMVIRAHLHIEHELWELVRLAAVHPSAMEGVKVGFETIVRVATALGLAEDFLAYKETNRKRGGGDNPFDKRSNRDRFILTVVSLRGGIVVAGMEASERKSAE